MERFIHLCHREPSQSCIQYHHTDGLSNFAAETEYYYDQNNGSPQGAFGNLTSTTKVNQQGASPITQAIYSSNGVINQAIDGNGNQTFVTYQCSGSLPYQIKNAKGQIHQYTFDCNTGLLIQYQDPNDLANSRAGWQYGYDSMRNPTSVTRPDNGSTSIHYSGNVLPVTVIKMTTATPNPTTVTYTIYDGFLKPVQVVEENGATSETTYDLLGRAQSVTAPHFSTPSPTDGITKTYYDALSRPIETVNPDGTTRWLCYNGLQTSAQPNCHSLISSRGTGAWIDSSDENGNDWQRTSNNLNELIDVIEPGSTLGTPSLETDYYYNALGTLLTVNQGVGTSMVETRKFTYNTLAQLLTSTNPETGGICYGTGTVASCTGGYDLDGNLAKKTDARGITATYAFDNLNRLTGASYSDGATASSCYQYDTAPTNGVGRLGAEWTQLPVCPASGGPSSPTFTEKTFASYDPMGRETGEAQCPLGGACANSYAFSYGYDLAGDETGFNNGLPSSTSSATMPALAWTTTYDAAARINQLQTSSQPWGTSNALYPSYLLSGLKYDPMNHITGENAALLTTSSAPVLGVASLYNDRGWITSEFASGTGGAQATGTITITGTEGSSEDCRQTCTTRYDRGSVSVTVDGFIASAQYGPGTTENTLAAALATALNASGSPVTAIYGNNLITMTSIATGTVADYSYSVTNDTDFAGQASGPTLTVGSYGSLVYSYVVPSGGYAGNGNLLSANDLIMGDWTYGYDTLNRLTSGNASTGTFSGQNGCWDYDIFGNRLLQAFQSAGCSTSMAPTESVNANNQITSISQGYPSSYSTAGGFKYDPSGNVIGTLIMQGSPNVIASYNQYAYDGAGRLCAVENGFGSYTGYLYDADGRRVAKGSVNALSCNFSSNAFTPSSVYLLDNGGNQVTELGAQSGQWVWVHSNVWAGSHLGATYDLKGLHFHLADPLGTRRVQTNVYGQVEETIQSLPFGDDLLPTSTSLSTADDATEHHFTGKERDTESGLDYFGARYYASNMGSWMSPDWADKPEAVPYSSLDNPQSLNLYGYVGNNPLSRADANGHDWCDACTKFFNAVKNTLQVKTTAGSGVEVSGGIGGVKVTAGASTKTEVTHTPFGDKPAGVKSTIESGLKAKVGVATLELTNKTPIGPGEGGLEGKAGASGETANAGISSDRSITVIGGSVGIGPVLAGAEISINADEANTALTSIGPAISGAAKAVFGNLLGTPSPSSGSAPSIFNLPQPQ